MAAKLVLPASEDSQKIVRLPLNVKSLDHGICGRHLEKKVEFNSIE